LEEEFCQNTMQASLVGTPIFLSPALWDAYENNNFKNIPHNLEKSDIYSLGATFLSLTLLLKD